MDPHSSRNDSRSNYYGPQQRGYQDNSINGGQFRQSDPFTTPNQGVSPYFFGQLQNNSNAQAYQSSFSTPTSQSSQPLAAENGNRSSGQNFSNANNGIYQNSGQGTNSDADPSTYPYNSTNSSPFTSSLNPNAVPFYPNSYGQVNVPSYQQVKSPIIEQQNPFSRATGTPGGQSTDHRLQNSQNQLQQNGSQNQTFQNVQNHNYQNVNNSYNTTNQQTPLSESQKFKLQSFQARLKDLDNEHYHILRSRKTDYPDFPDNPDTKYMDWRATYLMQAQLHNMHVLFDPKYVPTHIMFPLPAAEDAIFENRPELYQAAQDVHSAMVRNYSAMIKVQANALVFVLRKDSTARKFIRPNAIEPLQIFRDLDSMWIQQNLMTKGEFVTRFFKMKPDRDERFGSFMARVDALQHELQSMFSYEVNSDDILAVMQQGITDEMEVPS